jgi:alanyl-tRNA synthetase
MQHHSGQHLLSAVCIELFDFHTESFHLGSDTVTIDLSTTQLSADQMKQIEEKTNQYIFENLSIHTFFAEQDELKDLPLRKLPDVTENIRIVQMEGIDTSACCGTHVERTGEIGMLKLMKTEKQKGRIRLHFKCGFRALADYQTSQDTIQLMSKFFQTSRTAIPTRLQALDHETKLLQKENEQLKAENAAFIVEKMINEQQTQFVHNVFEKKSLKELQMIAARLVESGKSFVLLASLNENCVFFSRKGTLHCGTLFKEHLSSFQGKGGGNEKQAQAVFEDSAETERFYLHLIKEIEELTF